MTREWTPLVAFRPSQGQDAVSSWAQPVWVRPHVRSDGSYVQGHSRSAPDSNPYSNWSTQGNANPFTGKQGTVDPYRQQPHQGYNSYLNPIRLAPPTKYQSCREV